MKEKMSNHDDIINDFNRRLEIVEKARENERKEAK